MWRVPVPCLKQVKDVWMRSRTSKKPKNPSGPPTGKKPKSLSVVVGGFVSMTAEVLRRAKFPLSAPLWGSSAGVRMLSLAVGRKVWGSREVMGVVMRWVVFTGMMRDNVLLAMVNVTMAKGVVLVVSMWRQPVFHRCERLVVPLVMLRP